MPEFGKQSKERLEEADWRLQRVMEQAIKIMDFSVTTGYRGREAQEKAFQDGFSRARFGQSKHNFRPSRAVDVCPWPVDWEDTESFVLLAGVVKAVSAGLGLGDVIRWGGDWDSDDRTRDEGFRDYGHFEIEE
jgi:hypothetical protein